MKKILYIVSTLKKTGPTNQLFNIVKNLDKSHYEPELITLSPEPFDSRWDDFAALGVKMHTLGLSRLAGLFCGRKRLARLVQSISPMLIHTQGARADILSASLRVALPRICTVRNFPQLDYKMTYGPILGPLLAARQTAAFSRMTLCCCVSDAVRGNLQNQYGLQNSQTVLNGVDDGFFTPATSEKKKKIRERLGVDAKGVVWLSTIGKDARKNSTVVVSAFLDLLRQRVDDTLIFVGDGELRSVCEEMAGGSDKIRFAGKTNDIRSYLQASDYFISASKAEGMPNAVLEAMACGLPVVLSSIDPHMEIKQLNPSGAFLFDFVGEQSLLCTLSNIDTAAWEVQSKASLETVSLYFSSRAMSLKYQTIYSRLIKVDNNENL